MIFITIICLISLILGAVSGRYLAAQGVTAENALEKHQRLGYFILSAIAILVASLLLIGRLKLTNSVPVIVLLYIGEYSNDLMLAFGSFALGLIVLLEWPGRRKPKRFIQMVLAAILIIVPTEWLLHYSLPVTGILGATLVQEGIVLQTTSYTCVPACIATLARKFGDRPQLTERDVVEMAGTNRFGTSALAEISAMRQLGLAPRYERNLKIEDLIAVGQPAILHVNHLGIAHAIALLQINRDRRSLTVADPLSGEQTKTFEQMAGYWLGEAVFVTAKKA